MTLWAAIAVAAGCVALQAAYSGAEIAIGHANRARLQEQAAGGDSAFEVHQFRHAQADPGETAAGRYPAGQLAGHRDRVGQHVPGVPPGPGRNLSAGNHLAGREADQPAGDLRPADVEADRPHVVSRHGCHSARRYEPGGRRAAAAASRNRWASG